MYYYFRSALAASSELVAALSSDSSPVMGGKRDFQAVFTHRSAGTESGPALLRIRTVAYT